MIDWWLRWLAPHICEGCGVVGMTLCERCNFNILKKKWSKCIGCKHQMTTAELAKFGNLCSNCARNLPFRRVFVVGERAKTIKRLVGNYKYFSRRESALAVARLIDAVLPPELPEDLVVVPLPTIPAHIRERGFDHMKLVARELARRRGLRYDFNILERTDNAVQHSAAGFWQRQTRAVKTFKVDLRRAVPERILLLDDIYTTGATTTAAAKLLKKHGVKEIWLGIVARQVLK